MADGSATSVICTNIAAQLEKEKKQKANWSVIVFMSIKSEPAANHALHQTYATRPRFCDAIGGSLSQAFATTDDLSGFDSLLRQLDDIDDRRETTN